MIILPTFLPGVVQKYINVYEAFKNTIMKMRRQKLALLTMYKMSAVKNLKSHNV